MIAAGADVNQTQPDGSTPLHWAAYRVDRELVNALLRKGARAKVVNRYGASPLAEAVKVANAELVGMLLEAGADANVANEDGQTPLMLAARTGNVAVAELLVRAGRRRQRARTVPRPVGGDVGGGAGPRRDGGVPGVERRRPLGPRAGHRLAVADQQRAARAVPPGRRPDAAPLRRARGLPRLREGDGRSRRRQGPAEPRRHDADDHGARQRLSRRSRATCSSAAPTRTPGTGGAARRSTWR